MGDGDRILDCTGRWIASFADFPEPAEDRGPGAALPLYTVDRPDDEVERVYSDAQSGPEPDHSAERELLARRATGNDVPAGDAHLRLSYAIAFIAQKGLASEFALFLRSQ